MNLIEPHGGELVNLLISHDRGVELAMESSSWPVWVLTPSQLIDLELLINGDYSPLRGFLCRGDYGSVLESMHLEDGTFWPLPVVLSVGTEFAKKIKPGTEISLCNQEGVMIAVLHVEDIWHPDDQLEKELIFNVSKNDLPESQIPLEKIDRFYVGGAVEGFMRSSRLDFQNLRLAPADNRIRFDESGWKDVIAYQTVGPIHKGTHKSTINAAERADSRLLVQVLDGDSHPGDKKYISLVKSIEAAMPYYPNGLACLSVLRSKLRNLGPREALQQAIIAKNHGCSGFILDPKIYDPSHEIESAISFKTDDYEKLWAKYEDELGVQLTLFEELQYVEKSEGFFRQVEIPQGTQGIPLNDGDLERLLEEDKPIPDWFTFPEVLVELRKAHLPRRDQGFTVFFTGLSGAGKSTIANALMVKLIHINDRPVTLLDGDIVRRNLSSELGFSKEHRDINIRRIGFVASEITKNGGIAICAPIAPYDHIRKEVGQLISRLGGFILVHVSTPLEECENRDRKGLYAKARAGIIKEFTGISDPYESPKDANLIIDTTNISPDDAVNEIISYLGLQGYIEYLL